MKNDLRRLWVPEFEVIKLEVVGQQWPTIIVEKWETNPLGERRFTGESRTYGWVETPKLSQSPERMTP